MAVKKLIEVALPLDAINEASAREKSIRHGHPSTLHLWWARRPLAAARAVIWASLVDDPSSHPDIFPTEEEQTKERERLFRILEELVIWENSNNQRVIEDARREIRNSIGDELPPLLDPFAGGGAIPLEAQRLGLQAYAQDLNPVAVTINKAMIEIPPKFAGQPATNPEVQRDRVIESWEGNTGLAADVEYYGNWMKSEAYRRIGHLYPKVKVPLELGGGEATVIAWIWARTIRCPNPACHHEVPLAKSFDLAKKKGKEFHVDFDYDNDELIFKVKSGKSARSGTVNRQGAICPNCGMPIDFSYIREQGQQSCIHEKLMAVAATKSSGRIYISPESNFECELADFDIEVPAGKLSGKARVNVSLYGYDDIADLFTQRQLLALSTFSGLVKEAQALATNDALAAGLKDDGVALADGGLGAKARGEAIGVYLAFAIDKLADRNASVCAWDNGTKYETVRNVFGRQAIAMAWDFAEANPFSNSSGCFSNCLEWITRCITLFPKASTDGHARQFAAQSDNGMRGLMISTDPPYYDNIDYADLSDFFYVWLRKSLRSTYPKLFQTILVPKSEELVATPFRFDSKEEARTFFEEGMYHAFQQVYEYVRDDIPTTIYYAFKQGETETVNEVESTASTGWETMLSAIIRAGFSITGTWPMRTEMSNRNIAAGTNALASSIVLVCRKRDADAPACTRRDFVSALKKELKPALDKLQQSNIAPVDMAQSAIGPGIAVFSRYSKVLESDGSEMTVRSALQAINHELDIYFSDQDGDLDRESRFCVDLYTQYAFDEMRFGEADVLARAKNTSIEGLAEKGAVNASKGIVSLRSRDELDSMKHFDTNFTWLFTQKLARAMEEGGIEACAALVRDVMDSRAEHAKALAYRLFTIAERKGWQKDAMAYNSLVISWQDIQARAAELQAIQPVQEGLWSDLEG